MSSSPLPEPVSSELLAALEREVQELRAAHAATEREQAAIQLERAAIDAERVRWNEERHQLVQECQQLVQECQRLELERAQLEQALATAEQDHAALQRAFESQHQRLQRALRWSPRHRLGVLAHRSEIVRRLRSGSDD